MKRFWLSDVVWNPDNKQFAVAYSLGKVAYFVRMDAKLNTIGSPTEIKWDILPSIHPYIGDLSLVWNAVP